ncbi:hypothetical protein PENTCL1PPCAC_19674 [Pristionchus entomophagus]|uniref:Uncharacterized protein n=1 Tax=Pristionchus entomophagus TaxID=358040 RepID=A0AAV5TSR9_9BILA|nr:hypothetical protein PENTCL1PPCAC_19674 [Pristionchus entomophagus]
MFKCFGSAKRPKDDKDPKDWDAFFAERSTEGYLKNVTTDLGESSKQREGTQSPAPSAQAHTNSTAHCSDIKGHQAHSPPTIPNHAKHSGLSSTCDGHVGSAESDKSATVFAPRPLHDELQQLKDAAAAVPPATTTTATFGVLPSAAFQVPAKSAAASPSVSTDSGTYHDDASPKQQTSGGGGFHGFGGSSGTYTKSFDGFAAAKLADAAAAPAAPLSAFGTLPAELGGGGRASPAKQEQQQTTPPALEPPARGGGGFHGFGSGSAANFGAPSGAKSAANGAAARMFQVAMGAARTSTSPSAESGLADLKITTPPKSTVAAATPSTARGGVFECFRNGGRGTVAEEGFGSGRSTVAATTGFGSGRSTVNSTTDPFARFGSARSSASGFNTKATAFTPSSSSASGGSTLNGFGRPMGGAAPAADTVSFGTLRDTTAQQVQKRMQFEDEKRGGEDQKEEVKKDVQKAAESEDDTETEEEPARELPRPWGKRPCFRTMLDGGKKKLVLTSPPKGVVDYFSDHVDRSYGCCYDNVSNTFYATSPGFKGRSNGEVVALSGNCVTPAFLVASGLQEPAAIAVYEPGLSVCVVTNKGILVLTRRDNMQGEMDKFLCRQISHKPFHRGIATTAKGGIVSCCNGKIRMFDGSVANGDEKVLAEANYDQFINNTLFADNPNRRNVKSSPCFIDIVDNRLVMSDLQKHVISLWKIEESPEFGTTIKFVRAIDVAISANTGGGKRILIGDRVPLGKCSFASGCRMDSEGWVLCADAEGRTIQIFDNELKFVTRLETPGRLPYISGLYIEKGGHLMVCDRKSEMGGLRVYMLEARAVTEEEKEKKQQLQQQRPAASPAKSFGFAAAARMQGGRF